MRFRQVQLQSWILPRGFYSLCLHQFFMADVLVETQEEEESLRWEFVPDGGVD